MGDLGPFLFFLSLRYSLGDLGLVAIVCPFASAWVILGHSSVFDSDHFSTSCFDPPIPKLINIRNAVYCQAVNTVGKLVPSARYKGHRSLSPRAAF